MAIGQTAEWGDLLKGSKVELNRNGTAKADKITYQTAEPDIFVGGDIYHGARFAIDAIANGKEGMISINRFVHPGQSLTIGRNLHEWEATRSRPLAIYVSRSPKTRSRSKRNAASAVARVSSMSTCASAAASARPAATSTPST